VSRPFLRGPKGEYIKEPATNGLGNSASACARFSFCCVCKSVTTSVVGATLERPAACCISVLQSLRELPGHHQLKEVEGRLLNEAAVLGLQENMPMALQERPEERHKDGPDRQGLGLCQEGIQSWEKEGFWWGGRCFRLSRAVV
jgi:hypothetical protein